MAEASLAGEPIHLQVGGLRLAARRWGRRGGVPVLAVHGWMDNCASFKIMAPGLADCDLVCLDLAGHGQSEPRPHLGAYHILLDVADIFGAADQLGWSCFALLGHSRGAAAGFLAAGTYPERISRLFLLDGIRPSLAEPEDAPTLLGESIATVKAAYYRQRRRYSSFEQAVQARTKGFLPLDERDALTLAEQGVAQDGQGYYWCHDPKVAAVSETRLSLAQLNAFAARVRAPTHLYLAEQGPLVERPELMQWLEKFPQFSVQRLAGSHHFHMSQQGRTIAAQVAEILRR